MTLSSLFAARLKRRRSPPSLFVFVVVVQVFFCSRTPQHSRRTIPLFLACPWARYAARISRALLCLRAIAQESAELSDTEQEFPFICANLCSSGEEKLENTRNKMLTAAEYKKAVPLEYTLCASRLHEYTIC
jgi:hypothetical protein